MPDATIRMECNNCGKRVIFTSMSYGRDGKSLLCNNCYKRENPDPATKDMKEKDKYVCNSCKYKFSVGKGKKNIMCPYCGKKNVSPASKLSADNILKESILD